MNTEKVIKRDQKYIMHTYARSPLVLELTGRGQKDPFFSYLNELRRKLPVLHDGTGLTGDGELFTSLPAEYAEAVQKLHFWQYYRLKVE